MSSLKDTMPRRCLRLSRFAVGVLVAASLSSRFRFKELNSLSDPGVEQGLTGYLESTLLELPNDAEMFLSTTEKTFFSIETSCLNSLMHSRISGLGMSPVYHMAMSNLLWVSSYEHRVCTA